MAESHWYDEIVMPALIADARRTYGLAIRRSFRENGFDDMPRRGAAVVGGIANNGAAPQQDFARFLGISKQTASQLLDNLVGLGYVERTPDADDRRRVLITLTDRGRAAAKASRSAVQLVDRALARRVSADDVAATRRVLGSLINIADEARERRRASDDNP